MAVTETDIVNQAIQMIGNNQKPVTGNYPSFDTSPAGVAAAALYQPCVQTIARQFGWDFSRNQATLVATANTPPVEWSHEYVYPTNGIEVRQLGPAAISDPNNPTPIRWVVANVLVGSTPTKVIWTNLASGFAVFTNQPPPTLWDAGFREAVVRLLASEFAMALSGKPDTSRNLLESAQSFEQSGEMRDG